MSASGIQVRRAEPADWESIWPFYRAVVTAGQTYAIDPLISSAQAERDWMHKPSGTVLVAVDEGGSVVGTASAYPNRAGRGSHVASASFMVDPDRRGRGVGRTLGAAVIDWAREQGYRAIQFNAVVQTNTAAVALWKALGFQIIGTVPEAFDHPEHGLVGLHIMHRYL